MLLIKDILITKQHEKAESKMMEKVKQGKIKQGKYYAKDSWYRNINSRQKLKAKNLILLQMNAASWERIDTWKVIIMKILVYVFLAIHFKKKLSMLLETEESNKCNSKGYIEHLNNTSERVWFIF